MSALRIKSGRVYNGNDEIKLLNPETGYVVPMWDYSNGVQTLWCSTLGFRRTKEDRLISTRSVRVLSDREAIEMIRTPK